MVSHASANLSAFLDHQRKLGVGVVLDSQGAAWMKYERFAVQRYPTFTTVPPDSNDLAVLCLRARVAIASYIIEPDAEHAANSLLYVAERGKYNLPELPYSTRKNIKRAMQSLRYCEIDWDTLNQQGFRAYSDTRLRANLSDNTNKEFEKKIQAVRGLRDHHIMGCFHENQLAAYLGLVVIDDFAEITFWYSANEFLNLRSNDGLFYYTFNHYLNECGLRLISDGLSSLQPGEGSGLNHFKVKLGLEAKPVRRMFYVHPLGRPLLNGFTLACVQLLLRFSKKNRRIRKMVGVLHIILGRGQIQTDDVAE